MNKLIFPLGELLRRNRGIMLPRVRVRNNTSGPLNVYSATRRTGVAETNWSLPGIAAKNRLCNTSTAGDIAKHVCARQPPRLAGGACADSAIPQKLSAATTIEMRCMDITTIRRKSVSPISAFLREEHRIKRKGRFAFDCFLSHSRFVVRHLFQARTGTLAVRSSLPQLTHAPLMARRIAFQTQ